MSRPIKLREADLRPYQTHFLFQSKTFFNQKGIAALLHELPSVIDHGMRDQGDKCEILQQSGPRRLNGELIAWLIYDRTVPVKWAVGAVAPRDIEHHLVVLIARSTLLTVVATDKALGAKLSHIETPTKNWSKLKRVSYRKLESGLVHGTTRTLWLTGIHRSVATKPDSKVLIGPDIEASLDALSDQSFQYTSTRCEGPKDVLLASFVGITPRLAKVWLGPSTDWEVFLANSQQLLMLIESVRDEKSIPYSILARARTSLRDVRDAFDISLVPPEYLYEEDPDRINQLEALLQDTTWSVRPDSGPHCILTIQIGHDSHKFKIELEVQGDEVLPKVSPYEAHPPDEVKDIASLCQRPDSLKIFYESLHTYSNGQVFEVKTRPFPFEFTPCDFSNCDISLEKPEGAGGRRDADLSRIGSNGEPSLFTWVWKRYRNGWLWCDDGSGEIADFIHLDSNRKVLSLIHVKAAKSTLSNRDIAVAPYEVVCSQALKNLRYTERAELEKPLKEKLIANSRWARGWHNGNALKPSSTQFWSAVERVRYSALKRRIVIIQPHVRNSALPKDLSKQTQAARKASLLYTLLHGVKADVNRYGVEFEVLVDR